MIEESNMEQSPEVVTTDNGMTGLNVEDPRTMEIAKFNNLDKASEPEKPAAVEPEQVASADNNTTSQDNGNVDDEVERDPKQSWPKGFRKELSRKERQVDRAKAEIESLKAKLAEVEKYTEARRNEPKVKRSQFATEDEYLDFVTEQKANDVYANQQQHEIMLRQKQLEYESNVNAWQEKIQNNFPSDSELQEYAIALKRMGPPAQIFTPKVNEYIFKSQIGPSILKYISDRPDLPKILNDMHEWELASSLNDISRYIRSNKAQTQASPSKAAKVTSAPSPIGTVGGKTGGTKAVAQMTDAELVAYYRKGGTL